MRRALDRLYDASLVAAAVLLCAIAVIVLMQVAMNVIDDVAGLILGQPFGLLVPAYADFTGFFLAGASFLALAGTFRHGAHIRVTLLIHHLSPARRRPIELWVIFVAFLFAAYFTWYAFALALDSFAFDDHADGMVATPLWIPQVVMAIGGLVLAIALADEYVRVSRGNDPSYLTGESEWESGHVEEVGEL